MRKGSLFHTRPIDPHTTDGVNKDLDTLPSGQRAICDSHLAASGPTACGGPFSVYLIEGRVTILVDLLLEGHSCSDSRVYLGHLPSQICSHQDGPKPFLQQSELILIHGIL